MSVCLCRSVVSAAAADSLYYESSDAEFERSASETTEDGHSAASAAADATLMKVSHVEIDAICKHLDFTGLGVCHLFNWAGSLSFVSLDWGLFSISLGWGSVVYFTGLLGVCHLFHWTGGLSSISLGWGSVVCFSRLWLVISTSLVSGCV